MNQEYESNYEKVFSYFQGEFLKLDQEAAAEKLGLFCEEDAIMIPWFGNCWRIDRNTGIITDENGNIPDVTQRLLIMHHFCFFRMDAVHSDKWVPFRQIRERRVLNGHIKRVRWIPLWSILQEKQNCLRRQPGRWGELRCRMGMRDFGFIRCRRLGSLIYFMTRTRNLRHPAIFCLSPQSPGGFIRKVFPQSLRRLQRN